MSTHARMLADWLAAQDDDTVASLFERREVSPEADWNDFFDAADALLDTSTILRFLTRLDVSDARALATAADDAPARREHLITLGLVRPDGVVYPEVASVVADRLPVPPSPDAPPNAPMVRSDAEREAIASRCAERAFTTTAAIADIVLLVLRAPLQLLSGGTPAASERRRLVESGAVHDAEAVDDLLRIGEDAGLLRAQDRTLSVTSSGMTWLEETGADRWARLATGFHRTLPAALHDEEAGWKPRSEWGDAYPWDPNWPAVAASARRRALLLGLLTDEPDRDAEPPWTASLRQGSLRAAELIREALPAEVDRIFLQNDLTAISPGPLSPALDVRLRTMAERESVSQASSYRFTEASLTRALAEGETEQSVLDFLGALSLTGIPQPLHYLLAQTSRRHRLLRVHTVTGPDGAPRTRVDSDDAHLLEALLVDQSLRALGLTRDRDGLLSRVGRDAVFWSLADARYPATAVDEDGSDDHPRRHRIIDDAPEGDDEQNRYRALIQRLRSRQGPDADLAWRERELEAAVRSRAVLDVEVELPDGSTRNFLVEATGLGGGRLRGLDRSADVERTLPVRSIRSATVVHTR